MSSTRGDVTRGDFLKALGKSLPGMVLGTGVAVTARKILGKMSAVAAPHGTEIGATPAPGAAAQGATPQAVIIEPDAFIHRGPGGDDRYAITFDDGPTPGVTDRILDALRARGAHATFFMIGERVAAEPELARRVLAEGHTVANHSFTHPHLGAMPDAQVVTELQKTQDVLEQHLHHRATFFRPPFGDFRANQLPLARQLGLRTVLWSVDPSDWSQPGEEKIVGTICRETIAGSIIVCHDKHPQTANCLGEILDALLARGLRSVGLRDLVL